MSKPVQSTLHVNAILTNILIAYMQRFDALKVFPIVSVPKSGNTYFTFPREYWMTSYAQRRASGAKAARQGYTVSTDTYNCLRYALETPVPMPDTADADAPLNLDEAAARFLAAQMNLAVVIDWASKYWTTSVWTGSSTGSDITPSTTWENAASTPIDDIKTQIRALKTNTGQTGGADSDTDLVLACGLKLFDNLVEHPDIKDAIKGGATPGQPAIATQDLLASVFGVDQVVVMQGTRSTVAEETTPSYSLVHGTRNALLVLRAKNPGIMVPSGGYTFVWEAGERVAGIDGVYQYEDPEHESDIYGAGYWFDNKVVSSVAGVYFSNAVAA
jgi:hypothetical protein